ncbi:MAG: four helix bundle protein [Verrucomicrobiota bacterium]
MAAIKSFRDLNVYQASRAETLKIFEMTKTFPKEEKFALTDQIRRSSRAVKAMLAEAWARRRYEAAFINKINEAMGEAMETQSWLDDALDCHYISAERHRSLDDAWQNIGGRLNRMIDKADDFCKSRT